MNTLKTLLLALASASLLAACGGGSDDNFDDRADIADPQLRFVHAAEDFPALTLARNGNDLSAVTNAGFRRATAYFDVPNGGTNLAVRTTSGNVPVGSTLSFDAHHGNRYTLLAVRDGLGASLVFIDDPYNKSLTSDDARVRFVNGSANAPSFDIYVTAVGADIGTAAATVAAVPFREARPASGNDSIELEGGTYQLRATVPGTKTVIFNATFAIPANADWLFVSAPTSVVGSLVPNAIKMLLVRPDDPDRTALVINGSP